MQRLHDLLASNTSYLVLMFGFGLYWAWVDAAFFMSTVYETAPSCLGISMIHLLVIAIAIIPAILTLQSKHFSSFLANVRRAIVLAASAAFFGTAALLAYGIFHAAALVVLAIICSGTGMGLLCIMWGTYASTLDTRGASICIPGAFALAVGFGIIVSSAQHIPAIILCMAYPLVSALLLDLFSRSCDGEGSRGEEICLGLTDPEDGGIRGLLEYLPLRFLFILVMFFATFGIMEYLLVLPDTAADKIGMNNILTRGAIAFIIFIGTAAFSWKPVVTYKTGFLLMIAGFLAVPFVKNVAISTAVIMAGYTCYDMMAWIVICSLGNSNQKAAPRIIALARAVTLGGTLLGSLIGLLGVQWVTQDVTNVATIMTVVAYLLIIATVLVLDSGSSGFWSLIKVESDQRTHTSQEDFDQAVTELATERGLTPREKEVLGYLAAGRSTPWITEKLSISDGTGRAHVRHIYEKLDIHTRQELIDLIDEHISDAADDTASKT